MSELADRLEREQRERLVPGFSGHVSRTVHHEAETALTEAIAALKQAEDERDSAQERWVASIRRADHLRRVIEQMEDAMQDGRLTIKMSLSPAYLHEYDAALAAAEEALK